MHTERNRRDCRIGRSLASNGRRTWRRKTGTPERYRLFLPYVDRHRRNIRRYSPQEFESETESDTIPFGQKVETICRNCKNKANEAGQTFRQIIGSRDRHTTERVFHRPSDYATFRLSRYHRDGTLHSHDSYPPAPQGRQATEYRHIQPTDICARSRILRKIQRLPACQISWHKAKNKDYNQNNRYIKKRRLKAKTIYFKVCFQPLFLYSKRLQRIAEC